MKKLLVTLFSACLIFAAGCSAAKMQSKNRTDTLKIDEGFIEPEPSEWTVYHEVLTEYFHYRTQSVIKRDIDVLHDRYPSLSENISIEEGINIEENELNSYNEGIIVIDANYSIEQYDRLKVREISSDEVVLLVHGSNLYVTEGFGESGGEFLMELYLTKDKGKWEITKTDEYTISEYHAWLDGQKK